MRTRQVKDSELKKEWKRIDEALIFPALLADLPQLECTALTLLVDAMINSTVCDIGPGRGQITAKVDDEIYITLDVEQTVRNRISKHECPNGGLHDWEGMHADTAMDIWVFKLTHDRDYDRFPDGFKFPACVHGPKASIPALDDGASFVYWAEAGFPNPPSTILDAVLHARDPAAWQKAVDMRVRNHREARRLERMRQELLHAERLERQRKEKEAEEYWKKTEPHFWCGEKSAFLLARHPWGQVILARHYQKTN